MSSAVVATGVLGISKGLIGLSFFRGVELLPARARNQAGDKPLLNSQQLQGWGLLGIQHGTWCDAFLRIWRLKELSRRRRKPSLNY
jgi:hypothetical protein